MDQSQLLNDDGSPIVNLTPLNDRIREVPSINKVPRVKLDLESPRLLEACTNLSIHPHEMIVYHFESFKQKGIDIEIVELRYKHHLTIVKDLMNKVLEERGRLKQKELRRLQGLKDNKTTFMNRSQSTTVLNKGGATFITGGGGHDETSTFNISSVEQQLERDQARIKKRQINFIRNKQLLVEAIQKERKSLESRDKIRAKQVKIKSKETHEQSMYRKYQNEQKLKKMQQKQNVIERENDIKTEEIKEKLEKGDEKKKELLLEIQKEKQAEIQKKKEERETKKSQTHERKLNKEIEDESKIHSEHEKIIEKQQIAQKLYLETLNKRVLETKIKNDALSERAEKAQQLQTKKEEKTWKDFSKSQNRKTKRLKSLYNQMSANYKMFQTTRQLNYRAQSQVKANDDYMIDENKLAELSQRFERAEVARQMLKAEFDKERAIKTETRRLKEGDARTAKQREKAQLLKQKYSILQKEKEHDQTLQAIKKIEVKLQKTRQINAMQEVRDREQIKKEMSLKMSRSLPQLNATIYRQTGGGSTFRESYGGQTTKATSFFVTDGRVGES